MMNTQIPVFSTYFKAAQSDDFGRLLALIHLSGFHVRCVCFCSKYSRHDAQNVYVTICVRRQIDQIRQLWPGRILSLTK